MNEQQKSKGKSILAIFAHPDDELFVAPILSRYVKEGVDCHLAIATDGRFGMASHMNGLAGDDLADLRRKELLSAGKEIGINPPISMNFADGFSHKTPVLKTALKDLSDLYDAVLKLIEDIDPSVLITFGPDGVYGHPDHTTVGNVVTTLFQAMSPAVNTRLYYPGICIQDFPELFDTDSNSFDRKRYGLDSKNLPIKINFSADDAKAAHRSLSCHQSQFTQSGIDAMCELFHRHGYVRFRAWDGNYEDGASLF
ncbi:MAG: hypothetical protein CMQ21_02335 [Gammaproteobacteria bacterium]|jgi:LmbE family N-acetylglucosaminyl deacetylase|nr:hypothetical protein [Gammaproteobacteria bacterium]|tara:strand:- start:38155 stop:38916 length:762 start_codon:yes stop_codon:yes gene_type:complete